MRAVFSTEKFLLIYENKIMFYQSQLLQFAFSNSEIFFSVFFFKNIKSDMFFFLIMGKNSEICIWRNGLCTWRKLWEEGLHKPAPFSMSCKQSCQLCQTNFTYQESWYVNTRHGLYTGKDKYYFVKFCVLDILSTGCSLNIVFFP